MDAFTYFFESGEWQNLQVFLSCQLLFSAMICLVFLGRYLIVNVWGIFVICSVCVSLWFVKMENGRYVYTDWLVYPVQGWGERGRGREGFPFLYSLEAPLPTYATCSEAQTYTINLSYRVIARLTSFLRLWAALPIRLASFEMWTYKSILMPHTVRINELQEAWRVGVCPMSAVFTVLMKSNVHEWFVLSSSYSSH